MIILQKIHPISFSPCLSLSKVVTVSMIILQTECFLLCTFSWVLCVKVLSHSSHLMIRREDFSLQSCLPYPSCQKEAQCCLLDTMRTEAILTRPMLYLLSYKLMLVYCAVLQYYCSRCNMIKLHKIHPTQFSPCFILSKVVKVKVYKTY